MMVQLWVEMGLGKGNFEFSRCHISFIVTFCALDVFGVLNVFCLFTTNNSNLQPLVLPDLVIGQVRAEPLACSGTPKHFLKSFIVLWPVSVRIVPPVFGYEFIATDGGYRDGIAITHQHKLGSKELRRLLNV